MISFNKPINLNGSELRDELNLAGIAISYDMDSVIVDGNDNLLLDIAENDKKEAEKIVAKHNGSIIPKEPTIQEKLESIGISIEDLKSLLA